MNPSNRLLYQEHEIIVNAINLCRDLNLLINNRNDLYVKLAQQLLEFFRKYADGYHHYKEEKILFPLMAKRNEMLDDGILKEVLDQHMDFRDKLQKIEDAIKGNNLLLAQQLFIDYTETLLDHIAIENDEVFQIAESLFSESEAMEINFKYLDCDCQLGESAKKQWSDILIDARTELMDA
jgi:hemerythrin-like domain-containing protein